MKSGYEVGIVGPNYEDLASFRDIGYTRPVPNKGESLKSYIDRAEERLTRMARQGYKLTLLDSGIASLKKLYAASQ